MIIRSNLIPRRILLCRQLAKINVTNIGSRKWFSDDRSNIPDTSTNDGSKSVDWRKAKLDQLERKFTNSEPSIEIKDDSELQSEWKSMESRVTKRRTVTKDEAGGKSGRSNIRQTEEDVWLQSGLYHTDSETNDNVK